MARGFAWIIIATAALAHGKMLRADQELPKLFAKDVDQQISECIDEWNEELAGRFPSGKPLSELEAMIRPHVWWSDRRRPGSFSGPREIYFILDDFLRIRCMVKDDGVLAETPIVVRRTYEASHVGLVLSTTMLATTTDDGVSLDKLLADHSTEVAPDNFQLSSLRESIAKIPKGTSLAEVQEALDQQSVDRADVRQRFQRGFDRVYLFNDCIQVHCRFDQNSRLLSSPEATYPGLWLRRGMDQLQFLPNSVTTHAVRQQRAGIKNQISQCVKAWNHYLARKVQQGDSIQTLHDALQGAYRHAAVTYSPGGSGDHHHLFLLDDFLQVECRVDHEKTLYDQPTVRPRIPWLTIPPWDDGPTQLRWTFLDEVFP